ncbi:MAG: BadF/BadG/BcrA/BcrD ATPase family protein [Pseudomonadota bacterium]
MSPPVLIGVDGGGSGCRVAVGMAQAGVLAEAQGGPANVSTDFDASVANIMHTVLEALAEAGLGEVDLSHAIAHLGLAGADLPQTQAQTAAMFPFGRTAVSGDRETTVAGVLGAVDGFVVALGTGTILARQQSGQIRTVGGWGFQLSDQASGAWLGRALMTATLSAAEHVEPGSALTREIAAEMGGVRGIFDWSATARPADYAALAPRIFAAATAQDPVAHGLLEAGATYIENGLTALRFTPGAPLSLTGGVGPHYAPYLPPTLTAHLVEPKGNALAGAFHLARTAAAE